MTTDSKPTFGQTVLGGGTVFLIGIGLALAAFPQFRALLWTQEAAGWAQAFGGVGAILAAFSLGRRQADADRVLERMRRAVDETHRLALIDGVMENLQREVEDIKVQIDEHEYPIFVGLGVDTRIRESFAPLKAIPLFEVPSTELIYMLTRMPAQLDNFLACLSRYNASCDHGTADERRVSVSTLWNGCTVQQMMINRARRACRDGMTALGPLVNS